MEREDLLDLIKDILGIPTEDDFRDTDLTVLEAYHNVQQCIIDAGQQVSIIAGMIVNWPDEDKDKSLTVRHFDPERLRKALTALCDAHALVLESILPAGDPQIAEQQIRAYESLQTFRAKNHA